jgi:pimeloyl-ACP methyl ester carboxylesterase
LNIRLTQSLASAIPSARTRQIEGAGHAATFDATSRFVELVADTLTYDLGPPGDWRDAG